MTTTRSETSLRRGIGGASVIAGLAWVIRDLGDRMSSQDYMACDSLYGYTLSVVETIAFLAMVPTLIGMFVWYRRSGKGWIGLTAIIAAIGYAMAGIVNALEHCFVGSVEFPFSFTLFTGFSEPSPYVLGTLLMSFSIPFALTLTRVSFIPTWTAWLLVVGSTSFLAANQQGGSIVLGTSLAVVGTYLLTHDVRRPDSAGDAAGNGAPNEVRNLGDVTGV